jgi:hypothetical protein
MSAFRCMCHNEEQPAVPDHCVITFKQVNIHKATVPEGLTEPIIRACATQLASVFIDIFKLSLIQSVIPTGTPDWQCTNNA